MISPSQNHSVSKVGNKEYYKEYYRLNRDAEKERINAYKTREVVCSCGATIKYATVSIHNKSKKHTDNLKYKDDPIAIDLKLQSKTAYANGDSAEYQRISRKLREYKNNN